MINIDTENPTHWENMTWVEIRDLIATGADAAILPIGATEQHGPHLTVGMDSILGRKLCSAVSAATQVPLLPLLPYGCSLGHSHRWPGTLSLSPQTLISVITDIGKWLHEAGIRKLFIVNSHVTNEAPIRCAIEILRSSYDNFCAGLFNTGKLTPRIEAAFSEDAIDWHANSAETSLILALDPSSARPELIPEADDPDRTGNCVFSHPVNRTSLNGVTGSPSNSSVEAGVNLFTMLVEDLTQLIERGRKEKPPLDQSYFKSI